MGCSGQGRVDRGHVRWVWGSAIRPGSLRTLSTPHMFEFATTDGQPR